MAMLALVFRFGSPDGNERDNLHGQVQHCHTEEHASNPVNEYVYRCVQQILLRISFLLAWARHGGVSSRNGLTYSISTGNYAQLGRVSTRHWALCPATVLSRGHRGHTCMHSARTH